MSQDQTGNAGSPLAQSELDKGHPSEARVAGVGARKESNEIAFPRGKAKGGDAGKAKGQAEQVFVKPDTPKYQRWFLFGPFQNPPVHLPRLAGDGAHGCSPPGDNKTCDEDKPHRAVSSSATTCWVRKLQSPKQHRMLWARMSPGFWRQGRNSWSFPQLSVRRWTGQPWGTS